LKTQIGALSFEDVHRTAVMTDIQIFIKTIKKVLCQEDVNHASVTTMYTFDGTN